MNRFCFRVSATVALLTLAGCESSQFRSRQGGEWVSYESLESRWEGGAPGMLSVCGARGSELREVDGESVLCARIQLDEARLATVKAPAELPIEGTAEVPNSPGPAPAPTWTAGEGSASEVVAAWVTLHCFGVPLEESVTQRARGRVLLDENGGKVLSGRLVLEVEGTLAGACGGHAEGAEVDAHFSVSR